MQNRDSYVSTTWTWNQEYSTALNKTTFVPDSQDEEMDLTEAQALIARIQYATRN
jgi:hypothetical protein